MPSIMFQVVRRTQSSCMINVIKKGISSTTRSFFKFLYTLLGFLLIIYFFSVILGDNIHHLEKDYLIALADYYIIRKELIVLLFVFLLHFYNHPKWNYKFFKNYNMVYNILSGYRHKMDRIAYNPP